MVRPPAKPPIVRLPMWVNVVLVLILLGSCGGGARSAIESPDAVADTVVARLGGGLDGSPPAAPPDVRELCLLLGAVLDGQGKPVGEVFAGEPAMSDCQTAAQQGAAR